MRETKRRQAAEAAAAEAEAEAAAKAGSNGKGKKPKPKPKPKPTPPEEAQREAEAPLPHFEIVPDCGCHESGAKGAVSGDTAVCSRASASVVPESAEFVSGETLGSACVRGSVGGGDAAQRTLMLFEVGSVAQIRLLHGVAAGAETVAGTAEFDGGVHEGTETTLCAAAFDSMGRRFANAALPAGWLELSVEPRGAISSALNGSCVSLAALDEWSNTPPPLVLLRARAAVSGASSALAAQTFAPLALLPPLPPPVDAEAEVEEASFSSGWAVRPPPQCEASAEDCVASNSSEPYVAAVTFTSRLCEAPLTAAAASRAGTTACCTRCCTSTGWCAAAAGRAFCSAGWCSPWWCAEITAGL